MHHPAGPAVCPYLKKVYFIQKRTLLMCNAALQRTMRLWSIDTLFALQLGWVTRAHRHQHKVQCWHTLERKARLWCWHSGGSRCSLLCLCWAKLYTQFLKNTRMFVRFFLRSCRTEEPSATSYQGLCWRTSARRASDGDACPRSSFRSVHSQLTRNWLLINCVDLYFWAQSNFTWAKRPC